MTTPAYHVALVGLPGAGKTTVGQLAARTLGVPFIDLDAALVARTGLSVADQFAQLGEPAFRAAEAALSRELATTPSAILAPGGGWMSNAAARTALAGAARTIYLRVSPAVAAARLARDPTIRPLVADAPDPVAALVVLLSRRAHAYASADHVVDTDAQPPVAVAAAVVAQIRAWHHDRAYAAETAA